MGAKKHKRDNGDDGRFGQSGPKITHRGMAIKKKYKTLDKDIEKQLRDIKTNQR